MKIRIGSRKSDLAQIQSRIVAARLKEKNPGLEVDFVFKDVGVDLNLDISLVEAESKGLFTKDLSMDLIAGKIDLVVHSWKDLPTSGPEETMVIATLEREDPRDIVFIKKELITNPSLVFLSSSPRREQNLGGFLRRYVFPKQNLRFLSVRGNLPTRMRKFLDSNDEALVLALAAIKRLLEHGNEESKNILREVLELCKIVVVPVTENPPAAAQGALAIEIRKDRTDLARMLLEINHTQSFEDVIAERERLKDFGGGCHLKLGIYQKTATDGVLKVEKGLSPDGSELTQKSWVQNKGFPNLKDKKFFDGRKLNREFKVFDREKIEIADREKIYLKKFYLVSKTEALPDSLAGEEDILWTAGLETWKKLREKGHWVSGSQEALGERFIPIPFELWPEHKQIKLAHAEAPQSQEGFLATYRLLRNKQVLPDLTGYEVFYWPSGSLFRACLGEQPKIKEKIHICGMGNTFDELSKHIPQERLFSVINQDGLPQI